MNISYQLNPNMAIAGESIGNNSISESGAYIGVIKEAKHFATESNAEGIEIYFERNDGASAKYMSIYTVKKDGTPAHGVNQIHALMACLKVKNISAAKSVVKAYDHESKKEIDTQGYVYPELQNKPIGLVLQRSEYKKSDGGDAYRMEVIAPFNAETKQTSSEILKQKPAELLDKIVASLVEKKIQKQSKHVNMSNNSNQNQGINDNYGNDGYGYHDDIPF